MDPPRRRDVVILLFVRHYSNTVVLNDRAVFGIFPIIQVGKLLDFRYAGEWIISRILIGVLLRAISIRCRL